MAADLISIENFYIYCRPLFSLFDLKGSTSIIHLIVRDLDPSQLTEIVVDFINKPYKMIGDFSLLKKTVEWESYEQIFIWQIATLEITTFNYKIDVDIFNFFTGKHEALNGLLYLLRLTIPTKEIISSLLKSTFIYSKSIWLQWLSMYPDVMFEFYDLLVSIDDSQVLEIIFHKFKDRRVSAHNRKHKTYVDLLDDDLVEEENIGSHHIASSSVSHDRKRKKLSAVIINKK